MAKLMRAVAWRRLERPFTRKSKFSKHNYVRSVPHNKVVRFNMGNLTDEFPITLSLCSNADIQLRHNSLEAARQTSNRHLETKVGKNNYFYRLRVYPHHILRNNPLAAGAGADRMSTGMARSFGKVVGIAARVKKGQVVFEAKVNKQHIADAKFALDLARKKLPCGFRIIVEDKTVIPKAVKAE